MQMNIEPEGRFGYIGTFTRGIRNGDGVVLFPNGEEYSGEMFEGTPHGYGIARLEGRKGIYAGQWLEGRRHGWAVSTLLNGTLWAGNPLLPPLDWCSSRNGALPILILSNLLEGFP